MLQDWNTDNERLVGCSLAPMLHSITSLTTELLSILATMFFGFLLWKSHEAQLSMINNKLQITVYSDNKGAIGKSNEEAKGLNPLGPMCFLVLMLFHIPHFQHHHLQYHHQP